MTTPNLQLPEVPDAILLAADELRESFWTLDAIVQIGIDGIAQTSPPADAVEGSRYIIPAGATGAWSGRTNHIAFLGPEGWRYFVPRSGWLAWIRVSPRQLLIYDQGTWRNVVAGSTFERGATWVRGGAQEIAVPVADVSWYMPEDCTITGWAMLAEASDGETTGSAEVDVWVSTFAAYPPDVTDSIAGSGKPSILTALAARATDLSGWTQTQIAAGSVLRFHLNSISNFQSLHLSLQIRRD